MSKDDPTTHAAHAAERAKPSFPHADRENERRAKAKAAAADPNLDISPTATRDLLLRFARLAAGDVLVRGEQGRFDALTMTQAKDAAAVYRALMASAPDPLDQRPGESIEDYKARLTALSAAGK